MNIGSLIEQIDPYLKKGANRCCFRGQSQSWPLQPKAYRKEFAGEENNFIQLANSRLSQWKSESLPYLRELATTPKSEQEWFAVAQHFGLATRVADWTSNPLVALFFAVCSDQDKDGELIVWSFLQRSYNPTQLTDSTNEVVIFRPEPFFSRLRFQQGLLSYHPSPTSKIPDEQLIKISIPKHTKITLQEQLQRCGIDHESIFASLDHLAKKINWISTNHIAKLGNA